VNDGIDELMLSMFSFCSKQGQFTQSQQFHKLVSVATITIVQHNWNEQ
jgi:hypothetical protein